VLAGTCAAATFAIKPNAGVFAIAAATTVLLALGAEPDRRGRMVAGGDRVPSAAGARGPAALATLTWWVLWAIVVVGVLAMFGARVRAFDAVVFLAPPAVLLVLCALRRAPDAHRGLGGDAIALLLPFAAFSIPWIAFFYRLLGRAGFEREVLLIGAGFEELYYVPYPAFTSWGMLAALAVCAFALAGRMVARRVVSARVASAVGVLATLVLAAGVVLFGVMPEGLVPSIVWQLESAAFALVLVAHLAGVTWLARRRTAAPGEAVVTLLVFGMFMHLQLYPRTDFMHLVIAAPLTAVFASALLERVLRAWEEAASPRRSFAAPIAVVVIGLFAAVGAARGVGLLWSRPWVPLPFAVAPLAIEDGHARDHRDLAAATLALAAHVRPLEPSLGFPALDMMLFLTGARNPGAHGYFFPGRPDHREEAEVLDALVTARPEALASQNARFAFFDGAPPYYFLLRRYVRRTYALAERDGRFDVLVRARPDDASAVAGASSDAARVESRMGAPASADRVAGVLVDQTLAPQIAMLGDADPARREAAVAALLDEVARRSERGLEDVLAGVPLDIRATVLLLRTIRDTRDARAASYLFAMLPDPRPRVRRAVLEAMATTRSELIARRYLWAGTLRRQVWPAQQALRQRVSAALVDPDIPDPARAFAAYLAGELQAAENVPVLRRLLDAAPDAHGTDAPAAATSTAPVHVETVASAAAALAILAPRDLACVLTSLLPRRDPELRVLLPSLLLDLADREETAGETRACLRRALTRADEGREQAVWVAAALADGTFDPLLREMVATSSADLRRAAAWALGEGTRAAATEAALAAAAGDDDPLVHRIAARALAKQRGRAPRAFAVSDPHADTT
jgi:hypothetical protein